MTYKIDFLVEAKKHATVFASKLFLSKAENPLYSNLSQQYYSEYHKHKWKDVSICLFCDNIPKAFGFVFVNDDQASFFGMPIFFTLDDDVPQHLVDKMFVKLFKRLEELSVKTIILSDMPLLHSYFYKVTPIIRQKAFINLYQPIEVIKSNVRRSYKSLINWGIKNLDFHIIDTKEPSKELFFQFMHFHRRVAGKVTRSDASWHLQFKMITAGEGFALLANYQGELVAASLILTSITNAYYAVGVYDRNLMANKIPLAHGMLFKSIELAKKKGMKEFILGDVSNLSNSKEQNIAKFKSGFSSTTKNETLFYALLIDQINYIY